MTLLVIKPINWSFVVHGSEIRVNSDMHCIFTSSDYQSSISGYSFCLLIVLICCISTNLLSFYIRHLQFHFLFVNYFILIQISVKLCPRGPPLTRKYHCSDCGLTPNRQAIIGKITIYIAAACMRHSISVSQADYGVLHFIYLSFKLFNRKSENVVTNVERW